MFHIPDLPSGRLAILPRPRGGDWLEDEIASWKSAGLGMVISLLEEEEILELDLSREPNLCEVAGLGFMNFPISDRGVPESRQTFLKFVEGIADTIRSGQFIGIHCRMGVGRSACLAVALLKRMGIPSDEAWKRVQLARKVNVPDTAQQREWIDRL